MEIQNNAWLMYPFREPLTTFFIGLYLQLFVPSQPERQVAGVDFGEPTRDCMGRGQICRIDALEAGWSSPPDALGETWTDPEGRFHLLVREEWWNDSLNHWLTVPDEAPIWEPGNYRGERAGGQIHFLLIPKND